MSHIISGFNRVVNFYFEGFRNMSWWGRRVWLIVLIKLFVILIILKLFFFKDFLGKKYETDQQKSEYVLDQLIKSE